MKTATIFDIKRFAVHDGEGIRTTVFFKGCPLRCLWCHNPEGLSIQPQLSYSETKCNTCGRCATVCPNEAHSFKESTAKSNAYMHNFNRNLCVACGKCENNCFNHALRIYGKKMTITDLIPILLEDKDFYLESNGGITLSGGEPLIQSEFCSDLLKEVKSHNIHTAVDTCGAVKKTDIERVIPYTDVFLFDIKAMDDNLHRELTGKGNYQIHDNLRYIDKCGKKIEIRIPFIPNVNDCDTDSIGAFLANFNNIQKIVVLPYHHFYIPKYKALNIEHSLPPSSLSSSLTIEDAVSILNKYDLNAIAGYE